jgi:drug/metabolite transporter (DMT)-like permease
MILSALAFSIMALFVKAAGNAGIPVIELVAARSLVSLILSAGRLRQQNISLLGIQRGWLLARGLIGFSALSCVFYALTQLPLAEATVLQYLHPMFTALLALFFLRESPTKGTLVCILLSFVGLILVVRPEFLFGGSTSTPAQFAVFIAILGAFGSACAYVIVRKLASTEHPLVIVLYFPMVSLPATIPFLWGHFVMPQGVVWFYLLAIGLFTQVGQVALTKGMQTESASRATSFSYLQIVFAAILGMVVFNEPLRLLTLLGATLIISGAMFNLGWKKKIGA